MSEFNLKPVNHATAVTIMNRCWSEFYKKYSQYSNAAFDKNLHFSEKLWNEILGYHDDNGEWQKGLIDKLYDEMPYEFTSNICLAILKELEARDNGGYRDIYEEHNAFEGSHILTKVNALYDRTATFEGKAKTEVESKEPKKEEQNDEIDAFV